MRDSTAHLFSLHGRNIYLKIDGYLYLKYISTYVGIVARAFNMVSKIITDWNKFIFHPIVRFLTSRYHGKIILLSDARKIIKLEKDVAVPDDVAKSVIPYDMAYQIIFRNPDSIVAVECACRNARKHDCQPANKCLMIGEPFASFMLEHNRKANPIKLTRDEALDLLTLCKEKGYVTNAYCKDGAGNQMYAICNCCPECCVSISAHKLFGSLHFKESSLAHSGYSVSINTGKCSSRKRRDNVACVPICPFGAITMKEGMSMPVVDATLCMGCGTCAEACPEHAIEMMSSAEKGVPLNIHELVPASISK
ncbi:MAG TPA: 4Fe-4S binding protein [Spirochaetota bacterium]|nr:4Fe-4S binding protein [Spirochaetota bacterium]HPV40837.1 4Fe-4S binding protein [Spirochaetota bacterium]